MPLYRSSLTSKDFPTATSTILLAFLYVAGGTDTHGHLLGRIQKLRKRRPGRGFLHLIGAHETFTLFHYGSYESRFISSMGQKYGIPSVLQEKLEANCINLLSADICARSSYRSIPMT